MKFWPPLNSVGKIAIDFNTASISIFAYTLHYPKRKPFPPPRIESFKNQTKVCNEGGMSMFSYSLMPAAVPHKAMRDLTFTS